MTRPLQVLTRRQLGGVCLGGLGLLLANACKKAEAFSCDGVVGLSADEVAGRNALAYADSSPDSERTCEKCTQFVPADEGCGGCKVMKGPVHPRGTCKVFASSG